MIRFYMLGGLDLRDAQDREIASLLTQPKRIALLSCLAFAGPSGLQQRDWLLGVLWPELDAGRGRGALRNALHVLRRSLGEDVVRSHGTELVGLDRRRFWCDAVEFERALDRGDTTAVSLYRGDLLSSFYVPGAPEFEHWLEEQRVRLRERALGAAWSLADAAATCGDLDGAVGHAQQALVLARYDERAVRQLIAALDRAGNRATAVRCYQDFMERLAQDLQLEPSAETRALIEAVRSGRPQAPAAPIAVLPPRDQAPTAAEAPPESSSPREVRSSGELHATIPETPVRGGAAAVQRQRRALHLTFGALVAVGLLLAGAWGLMPLRAEERSPDAVAIFPFAFHGSDTSAYLGEGVVSLLSANLSGLDGLKPVDARALLGFLERRGTTGRDPERSRTIAQRFQAEMFVLGEIVEVGGRVRISAALYRRAEGWPRRAVRIGEAAAEGRTSEIFELVGQLARELTAIRRGEPAGR